jgi:NADH-quinone oxidoreductase subunit C
MNQEEIIERLTRRFGPEVISSGEAFRGQTCAVAPKERLREVCRFLRDEPDLAFDFLSFVCGVDRFPEAPRFEVVYQMYSTRVNHRFRIKTLINDSNGGAPAVDSVVEIWPTANWHERETSEMFGITFVGHPDPRKLLLPNEWEVHPLRKDFPLEGTDDATPDLPAARRA